MARLSDDEYHAKAQVRIRSKAHDEGGCWVWDGVKLPSGYGVTNYRSAHMLAHRAAYRVFTGEIPVGLTIDHLCKRVDCVNPAHLEAVTMQENLRRGNGPASVNRNKTHCSNGHPFDDVNTYRWRGKRRCRPCQSAYVRTRREAKS